MLFVCLLSIVVNFFFRRNALFWPTLHAIVSEIPTSITFFTPILFNSFICNIVVKPHGNLTSLPTRTHECVDYRYMREYVFVFDVSCYNF